MRNLVQISAFLTLTAILFLLHSCAKPQTEFPFVPHIEYKSHELVADNDGTFILKIFMDFTDGDGDIGLEDEDTAAPFNGKYFNNLHADYFEKVNGAWKQIVVGGSEDTIDYNSRIPLLTPKGKEKAIKGEIEYDAAMGFGPPDFPDRSKTIKLRIHIYDRALHKSNEIETPEITFP